MAARRLHLPADTAGQGPSARWAAPDIRYEGIKDSMTTTLLLSPPATGKTARCIRRVREVLKEQPLSQVWAVLPDRLQTAAFRRRLAASGGAMGAHVGTFGDLYQALLARAGRAVPLASEAVVYGLIKAAVRRAREEGALEHFAPIAETPGFIAVLIDRFAELKRARVLPASLADLAADGGPALQELAALYTAYQVKLQELGWEDSEGLGWLAVETLSRHPQVAQDIRLLVVDGFDAFGGTQLTALQQLEGLVGEMLITLPGMPSSRRAAHRRFARPLAALQGLLPEAGVQTLDARPRLPPDLARLEAGLFEAGVPPAAGQGAAAFLEASTPADEAREALRWVKARIVRDELWATDCALVVPDPESYRAHLLQVAAEFGLPLRFTHGQPLVTAPGVAALLDLLALPLRDWPRRETLDALRAPYFDLSPFNLGPQAADALERVSRYAQVVGGLDLWREALEGLAGVREVPGGEDQERLGLAGVPIGSAAGVLWERLAAFAERLAPPASQRVQGWVGWLEDLLEELAFFANQETPWDQAAALALRDALRALVLRDQVTDQPPVDLAAFLQELRSLLESLRFQERARWSAPAIWVLSPLEARGLRFKAVAVLGLSEGLFPQVEREDPFLDEAVRQTLGLEPRLGREQAGLFYQAVTRADRTLLLTRPAMTQDGEPWEPSPFWSAAQALFTGEPARLRPTDPRPLKDAASPQEVLFLAVRRGGLPKETFAELAEDFARLREARQVLAARLAEKAQGPYEGDLAPLQSALAERYGTHHLWSASRLESYGTCPMFFYVAHVLGLERVEPPELGFDALQLGLILHAILEQAYQRTPDPQDPEAVLEVLEEVAAAEFQAAPAKYGFRPSPLWEVEKDHLLEKLRQTVRGLARLPGRWRPAAFERAFGMRGTQPLVLETDAGAASLRGVIDRVDVNESGGLRVIDYKAGGSHLAKGDLIEGRRLQLPLYALAVRDALGLGEPVEGLYWKILAAEAGSLKLSRFQHEADLRMYEGPEGAMRLAIEHVGRILAGVRAGTFAPQPPKGGCPRYCPAAQWCWRYEARGW